MQLTMADLLQTIFLFVFLLIGCPKTTAIHTCNSPTPSSTIPIFHIYGKCSPFNIPTLRNSSWLQTVITMAERDISRLTYLSSLLSTHTNAPISSGKQLMQTANYVVRVRLGSPPQTMFMVLDTSSDSAWIQCSGCQTCPFRNTMFSTENSSTYSTMDCSSPLCSLLRGATQCTSGESSQRYCTFSQSYGDSTFSACLSADDLTLGSDVVENYAFGCINSVTGGGNSMPKQGLLGMGRGPTSLLSQTEWLYRGVFSYCFPSFTSYFFSGSLRLGRVGQRSKMATTPLLYNPRRPSLYYVNLTGISVGRTFLDVEQDFLKFDPSTGAGTIIDSGTVISRLVTPLYNAVRDEFRYQVGATEYTSLGAFDTCFSTEKDGGPMTPKLTLHFTGLNLVLPMENTLIHSTGRPLACLAMAASPDNVNSVLNVIANLQQQNHRVLFDVPNSRVGIVRELCS